jgi:hypothetical protein
MPRKLKRWNDAAARARKGRAAAHKNHLELKDPKSVHPEEETPNELTNVDNERTKWTGGVNHASDSDSDRDFNPSSASESEPGSDEEFSELEGDELLESLQRQAAEEAKLLQKPVPYEELRRAVSRQEWKKAEAKRGFGYTGNSGRTKRRQEKSARDRSDKDAKLRKT